jgi:hypothetical protein
LKLGFFMIVVRGVLMIFLQRFESRVASGDDAVVAAIAMGRGGVDGGTVMVCA